MYYKYVFSFQFMVVSIQVWNLFILEDKQYYHLNIVQTEAFNKTSVSAKMDRSLFLLQKWKFDFFEENGWIHLSMKISSYL